MNNAGAIISPYDRTGYAVRRPGQGVFTRRGFPAQLTAFGGTAPRYDYGWAEQYFHWDGNKRVFQIKPGGRSGTINGGTGQTDLGPAGNRWEMATAGVGGPTQPAIAATAPIPAGTYVWMDVFFDDQAKPQPFYQFEFVFPPLVVKAKILDIYGSAMGGGGAGRYKIALGTGLVTNLDPSTNYRPPDSAITFHATANAIGVNQFEGGSGANGTNIIDTGRVVLCFYQGQDNETPALPVYYFDSAPTGTLFDVLLTVDPTTASKYTATTLGGTPLTAASVAPEFRPHGNLGGNLVAATRGVGYLDNTAAFHLRYADEGDTLEFPVALSSPTGSYGTPTTFADLAYTVSDLNGNQLGTTIALNTNRPAKGLIATAATHGFAHMNGTTVVLDWVDEVHGTATCS